MGGLTYLCTRRAMFGDAGMSTDFASPGELESSDAEGVLPLVRRLTKRLETPRFLRFCAVGLLGIGVNEGILTLLVEAMRQNPNVAFAIATEVSILGNFLLNDRWTFGDLRPRGSSLWRRAARYNAGYLGGVAIQLSLFFVQLELLGWRSIYPLAALVAIGASTLWNYWVSRAVVWGRGE